MVHAFIMVKTDSGESEGVRDAAADLDEVTDAHVVAGEFDVLAEAECDAVPEVLRTVSKSLQGHAGVTDTKTYLSMSR